MNWNERYPMGTRPTEEEIANYINSPLWRELCCFVEENWSSVPSVEYSRCSGAPGWNVKYKKGSKAICTLYPNEGYYTCMISVGRKQTEETEILLLSCTKYLQELYSNADLFNGGRWLMIDVTSPEILDDVKELIKVRMK